MLLSNDISMTSIAFILFLLFIYVCVFLWVCSHDYWNPWRPEEGVLSLGSRGKNGFELPFMYKEKQTH